MTIEMSANVGVDLGELHTKGSVVDFLTFDDDGPSVTPDIARPTISPSSHTPRTFDPRFKVFHELMAQKVRDVLLISTPYDAWIMQEDGRLSERIVNEYRGLNLSHPPRLSWVSTGDLALAELDCTDYDLVIIMARAADREAYGIGEKIKKKKPQLRIALLTHRAPIDQEASPAWKIPAAVDETFVWSGNTDILLAMVKCTEDTWNIDYDTAIAGIRVIILIEDSPAYISALLPILYKQLVIQAQTVMEEGLNEEHRLLAMRARPKVIIAGDYEEARQLFEKYEPFVLGVISDARIPRNGLLDESAGVDLLMEIKQKRFDIPRLLYSAESGNASKAKEISAVFVDKHSPCILSEIRSFLSEYLGFGDFVFRNEDGSEIFRASDLLGLECRLQHITDAVFIRHCRRNDFSRWLFARSEIELASKVRKINCDDFSCNESHRLFLISIIHERRMQRQKGVVVNFDPKRFDTDTEFLKIGCGSLGGKARGLAFMSALLHHHRQGLNRFKDVTITITIPQALVISTDAFDAMVETYRLKPLSQSDLPDAQIAKRFLSASFPEEITDQLRAYLSQVCHPLAVRSSSLLEDARFRAYAGLYKTYMLPNDHADPICRLNQLIDAVKLVYASTYFEGPKAFARRVGHRTEEEKMAVIIHRLSGARHGQYFYPTLSGVAQSHNYYPFSAMRPDEGVATIALGLGKAVMGGERVLRFSLAHPQMLPQSANVKDTLKNVQGHFYAVEMGLKICRTLGPGDDVTLVKREIADAEDEPGVHSLLSTYLPEEDRIRDAFIAHGHRVLTFAKVLKYNLFPLAEILKEILAMGQDAMGCPVEIEFSADPDFSHMKRSSFSVLQIRPMSSLEDMTEVDIDETEIRGAVCLSTQALGNTTNRYLADIIYVKPDTFVPAKTMEIAREIGRINAKLVRESRKYLLVGPGRWGAADRWLGIPVTWLDICGVGAILETAHLKLRAEPSQGSHFFHNMASLGINYFTVFQEDRDRLDWQWLTSLPKTSETEFLAHVRLDSPLTLKVDGRRTLGVILSGL